MLVTRDHWCVSFTTCNGMPEAELRVFRPRDALRKSQRGDHSGRRFPSVEAARAFAASRGYLQIHVNAERATFKRVQRQWLAGVMDAARLTLLDASEPADVPRIADAVRQLVAWESDPLMALRWSNAVFTMRDRLRPDLRPQPVEG